MQEQNKTPRSGGRCIVDALKAVYNNGKPCPERIQAMADSIEAKAIADPMRPIEGVTFQELVAMGEQETLESSTKKQNP
mgnify:FL=1